MTTRVRSFSLDLAKSARPLLDATKLWQAFCQAAGISVDLPITFRVWDTEDPVALNRALPDVEGEPPVEIVTTDRSRRGYIDMEREVRIRGPRRPLEFRVTSACAGMRAHGLTLDPDGIAMDVELPRWILVSASVDFGPDGSLDRAWAVLELFAGWEPGHADEWDLDDIADALSEVPELHAEYVEDNSVISTFLDETPHVQGYRLIQQPLVPHRESDLELCERTLARRTKRDRGDS